MRLVQALLSVALITTSSTHEVKKREASEKRIVCYYTNWSVYRPGTAKYNPQNINPYLCTHLIYAFGGLDRENGLRPYDKYQDIEQGGYAKFTGLKTYNKALKTMLAIGGWNEGSARFSPLVADEERRAEFVKNVVKFLRQNHFDGLDLDWEYPAFRDGGKSRDRANYAQLVQELREEFDREHSKTGRPRLLLTMAVPAGIEYIDKGYDIEKLNRYLDFMNILSYDYHSAFEPAVNHHSPLYPIEEESEYNFDAQLSIDYTIKHYLKLGADRDKLVLGIPTYGRSYTLFNPDSTDLGAPADGPGEQGDATREKGYLAYYEICGSLKASDDWVVRQPKRGAMGPYAYSGNQWVGYDDVDIVKEKAQYVSEKGLGGIMFWSIDNDDFRGVCHDRPYPLIEAGKEALLASSGNNDVSSPVRGNKPSRPVSSSTRRPLKPTKLKTQRPTTTTPSPPRTPKASLTTPEPPTTPDPGSDFVCKDEGFFPHPRDCKKYFWCLDSGPSNLGIVAHQFTCPSGLYFNKAADSCDYTRNVICNKKEKEKPTTKAPKITPTTSKTTSSRITTTTTTTTTTEAPEEEEDDEEYYEEHAEEDPQAIKQLIQLIKKLGGVAELEKQLEGAAGSDSTPPPIPRSLYNKVITPKQRYQSSFVNGPSGPQNEGLSHTDDGSPYNRREKPQYVTIRRDRPSTEAPKEESEEDDADTYEVSSSRPKYQTLERNRDRTSQSQQNDDEPEEVTRSNTPKYATIQRNRPAKTDVEEEEDKEEDTYRPRYTSIQRSRPTTTEETISETTTSRYVTLRRQRPQIEKNEPEDEEEDTTTQRSRGTTIPVTEEPVEDDKESDVTSKIEDSPSTTIKPKIKVSSTETFIPSMTSETKSVPVTVTTEFSLNTNTATSDVQTDYNRFTTSETILETNNPTTLPISATTIPVSTTTIPVSATTITDSPTSVPNSSTTVPVTSTTELPSTVTLASETVAFTTSTTEIPTVYTLTTESNTEVTEPTVPSTTAPTTVPYQTSTITRIVTMVVEGATERQRIPINKLQEAIAQHNYTRYANANLLKPVKEQQTEKIISKEDEKKTESAKGQEGIVSQYVPKSNYRGRIKKPLIIEPPTTKSLPLYLSRRRSTTTTEASEVTPTEEPEPTTKSKGFGRFTPSRFRGRGKGKGTTTTTEQTIKETFTLKSRTRTTRPTGSRFKTRTRTTTPVVPLDEEEDVVNGDNEPEDIRKELSLINQGNGYAFVLDTEPETERPKFVPRGRPTRIFTTTESTVNDNKETTQPSSSPTRSRFVLSRGRTRLTTEKPKEEEVKPTQNTSRRRKISKENTDIFKTNSRFKIDRQRKTSVRNESVIDKENINKDLVGEVNSIDKEKEEILISQENTNGKTNLNSLQIGVNKTGFATEKYLFRNASGDSFNVSVLIPTENTTEVKRPQENVQDSNGKTNISLGSTQKDLEGSAEVSAQDIDNKGASVDSNTTPVPHNESYVSTILSKDIDDAIIGNTENKSGSTTENKKQNIDPDSFIEHDEEDLNLIASLYSPQSFTGRGTTRFTNSKNLVNDLDKEPKTVSRKDGVRNLKNSFVDQTSTEFEFGKSETLGKSSEEANFRKPGRRKVLVRKNKTNITSGNVDGSKGTTPSSVELNRTAELNNREISRQKGSVRAQIIETNNTETPVSAQRNGSRVKKIIVRNRNNNGTSRVKVIQSRIKDSDGTEFQGKRRKVVVKNRARNDITLRRGVFSTQNDSNDLIDLDTGTSLYVDRKTESNINGFNNRDVPVPNDLLKGKNRKLNSRGKLRAKDSLLKEDVPPSLFGGVDDSEEYYENEEESADEAEKRLETEKIGATRLRSGFRKPGTVSVPRSRSTTTTTEISPVQTEKPAGKFIRRRVNKLRIEVGQNGTINKVPLEVGTQSLVLELTTQKPRKFEFPRRAKPAPLPTASPLLAATSSPIVVQDFEDNHSDESLHDVDTEIVESKEAATEEFLDEVSRLPDLANVAVAAIQSLATVPPSTETIPSKSPQPRRTTPQYIVPSSTSPQPRRTSLRTVKVTTTTTVRPKATVNRGPPRPFAKVRTTTPPARSSYITKNKAGSYDTPDYEDYYAEPVDIPLSGKVRIHNDGYIECLDIGNFPHPFSCKKFISCAKMENGHLLGWEYTCPKGLSFDPIGGICNWSAGLGCKE